MPFHEAVSLCDNGLGRTLFAPTNIEQIEDLEEAGKDSAGKCLCSN